MSDFKIHAAMANILNDCVPIAKDRRNKMQGFQFRGIDDAYNALHPVMSKHQVITVPRVLNMEREERQTKNGGTLIYTMLTVEYDFVCGEDGSKITVGPVIGEAMDTGDKSCNKALSMAHKSILLQTFTIPTHSDDADATTHADIEPKAQSLPATDGQYEIINKGIVDGFVSKRTQAWFGANNKRNWTNLNESQARSIIEEIVKQQETKGE